MAQGLLDRMLALLGLDLDFSVSLGRDPFNAVADDVYLGGRPAPDLVPQLREAGVTHVVSCLPDDARKRVSFLADSFHTLFIPARDGMYEDISASFPAFFDFVRDAPAQNEGPRILVHCEAGVSRSATLAIALQMHRTGQGFYEAYRSVRAKRSEVLPNIGFATQLQQLEFSMRPRDTEGREPSSLARYLREVCVVPVDVATIQDALDTHDHDAVRSIKAIFGDEIPRVVQGVRI